MKADIPSNAGPGNSGRANKPSFASSGMFELFVLLPVLLKGSRTYALALFGFVLLSAIAEGLGFSLVVPLLQTVLSSNGDLAEGTGFFQRVSQEVAELFDPEWRLLGLLSLLIALFFVKSAALVAVTGMMRWFSNTLRLQWVASAFVAFIGAPYEKVVSRPHGEIVQNIIGESENAARAMVLLVEFLARLVQIFILFTLLLLVDWRITLVITAVAASAFAFIWKQTHDLSLNSGIDRQQIRQSTTDLVSESISALRVVKLLDLADARTDILRERLRRYRYLDTTFSVVGGLPSSIIDLIAIILGTGAILFATAVLQLRIEAVLPTIALFGVVFLRLMAATGYLFSRRMNITTLIPSLRTVHDMIVSPPEQEPGGAPFPGFSGDIRFEHIHLRPPDRDVVFDDLELRIPARGVTAIVGPSGSGKTTLVDLLVRLREPDRGRITVNGQDIRQFDVRSIRARVGYLSQDPQLFNGSIRENLLIGHPDAGEEEMHEAARRAHAHDFIVAMPEGYNTEVGRGGVTLSGGQRQRLALARELVRAADLYIFDEPTSALDHDAEAAIEELISELSQTHPVIVIAHRRGAILSAQVIYRLKNGKALPTVFDELSFLH